MEIIDELEPIKRGPLRGRGRLPRLLRQHRHRHRHPHDGRRSRRRGRCRRARASWPTAFPSTRTSRCHNKAAGAARGRARRAAHDGQAPSGRHARVTSARSPRRLRGGRRTRGGDLPAGPAQPGRGGARARGVRRGRSCCSHRARSTRSCGVVSARLTRRASCSTSTRASATIADRPAAAGSSSARRPTSRRSSWRCAAVRGFGAVADDRPTRRRRLARHRRRSTVARADARRARRAAGSTWTTYEAPASTPACRRWAASSTEQPRSPPRPAVLERSVSFTKGCYTGQELVARIDSRGGNVPRHVRGVRIVGDGAVGDARRAEGRDVGEITSAVADAGGTVALAVLARVIVPPATVVVLTESGRLPGSVFELPARSPAAGQSCGRRPPARPRP